MKGAGWEIASAVFLLALVSLLVRPSSYAPAFIKGFGDAMTEVITFAVSG